MDEKWKVRQGDIFYIDREPTYGSEQRAGRPGIIVSNDINNEHSNTVEVVYLTTQPKNNMPTHVRIDSAPRESTALCEQITSVAIERLGTYVGRVTESEMTNLKTAMLISLGLIAKDREPKIVEVVKEVPVPVADDSKTEKLKAELQVMTAKYDVLQQMYNHLIGQLVTK